MLWTMRGILLTHRIATATEDLKITVDHGGASTLVCLRGRLNIDSSPTLRNRLIAELEGQLREGVVIDLMAVSYIGASGIATLVEALKTACSRGTAFRLKGCKVVRFIYSRLQAC